MHVVALEVPALGNRFHLAHDGARALVVDPPRDVRVVEEAAERAEVEIAAVADTHVHNDYVSGALALARRHGADYLLSAEENVRFERVGVRDGDSLDVGGLVVQVVGTPGHTRHHQSFLVRSADSEAAPAALFSGGSLLHGTVGRTDLVDRRLTRDLAAAQWASARRLGALDPRTTLHPTHGFGSFCASGPAAVPDGTPTVGDELAANPALVEDRAAFVDALVAGLGPIPAHYAHMGPLNRRGAGATLGRPARRVTADEVSDAVLAGSWVVDLRDRAPFAQGHLPGSVSVEYSHQFATYVGWLVPWGDDIVLLTDDPAQLEPALSDLATIGIDGVGAHVLGDTASLTGRFRRADWQAYLTESRAASSSERLRAPVVVDVRQRDEWHDGHLPGAVHLPVHDVDRLGHTLPPGELWVHCRSGYRAGIAASVLQRAGRDVVHVDDAWERVAELAIPTVATAA